MRLQTPTARSLPHSAGVASLTKRAAEFESAFAERARLSLGEHWTLDRIRWIVPAPGVAVDADDGEALLLGWWCSPPAGTVQPVLPNPWDDPEGIHLYRDLVHAAHARLIAELAARLNALHGTQEPPAYWDAILGGWLNDVASVTADRSLLCRAAATLAPQARFLVVPPPPPPRNCAEALDRHVSDDGNLGLFSLLVEALRLPSEPGEPAPTPPNFAPPGRAARLAQALQHPPTLARTLSPKAMPLLFGGRRGRRALVINVPLRLVDAAWLRRRAPGTRFGSPAGRAWSTAKSGKELREQLRGLDGGDDPGGTLATLLPALLPRSVVEDYPKFAAKSRRRWGDPCGLVNGNLNFDEVQNEYMGRCLTAGRNVALAQHGGGYRTYAVNNWEQVELRPDVTFLSWGWRGEGIRPLPSPYLSRLRDSHHGGEAVVLIEIILPRYLQRFVTYPQGSQTARLGEQLLAFVEAVGRPEVRAELVLKRSIAQGVYRALRDPRLERLPHRRFRSPRATDWMRRARVAVVSYPDTTFIEALAIGVPTIGLWDPQLWRIREEARPFFAAFEQAGAIFADPAAAAARLDEIYDSALLWWRRPALRAARDEFLEHFGLSGEWRPAWAKLLREIAD